MFRNLYEINKRTQPQVMLEQNGTDAYEHWQVPPAPTEELPPGLIGDEI